MTGRKTDLLARLSRDEQRRERLSKFALLTIPLIALILLGGHRPWLPDNIRAALMQGALNDAARIAAVEDPAVSPTPSDTRLKSKIEAP